MARTLSPTLAAVVEELEFDQPTIVTASQLRDLVAQLGLGTSPNVVAARLRAAGWLLATGTRGVWEFAPGAHAGPIGHHDPALPLRSALASTPSLGAALTFGSAAWALGFADRVPATLDVVVPVGRRVPPALARTASVTTFTAHSDTLAAKGVPCLRPESVLVHLVSDPAAVRSWGSVLEWLAEVAAEADADVLSAELEGRPRAVSVRAGYLLAGLRPDLAEPLQAHARGVVRFGRRTGEPLRHSAIWRVLDYLLPSDPATWAPLR